MKKIMKYPVLLCAAAFALTGCENPTVEETLPYYYTETIAYLPNVGTQTVSFKHTPSGIQENAIAFKVARKINSNHQAELKKECTVVLEAAIEGIDPQYVSFRDGLTMTIPAGETEIASAIDIDWSFASAIEEAIECSITLTLTGADIRLSTERTQVSYEITKKELSYFYTTVPTSGSRLDDRSSWEAQYTTDPALSNWKSTTSVTDGKTTYLYPGTNFLAIMADMGEVKHLTGVVTYSSYGSNYSPSAIIVETSMDGVNWNAVGPKTDVKRAYYVYASFYEPIDARYFRMQLFGNNVLSTEIYAYAE